MSAIAFLRIDVGGRPAATTAALTSLYERVLPGGFVYVEDYGNNAVIKEEVDKFRADSRSTEDLYGVSFYSERSSGNSGSNYGVWWQKEVH